MITLPTRVTLDTRDGMDQILTAIEKDPRPTSPNWPPTSPSQIFKEQLAVVHLRQLTVNPRTAPILTIAHCGTSLVRLRSMTDYTGPTTRGADRV